MCNLPKFSDPNLIVGFDTSDDACVYKISDELVLIQTVDFFPPIVDDPYMYGQIAATNALSDIYAMGASPTLAMNLLCYPSCLPQETVQAILAGGYDKVREAGAIIAGGHTIEDSEPKYGLCVSGFAHPDKILKNSGAQTGDLLILTKPLGIGILTTAAKADMADADAYKLAVENMSTLNKAACEVASRYHAHACTDVTGFGLLGHAFEMADGSRRSIKLFSGEIPVLPTAVELAEMGIIPAGAYTNMNYLYENVKINNSVARSMRDILADPQTAGGLLVSVSVKEANEMLAELQQHTPWARIVGEVVDKTEHSIIVE